MDVLIVGDVHLADKAPSSRKETYTEEILAKLTWCVEFANEKKIPLVQAGDLFHIKTPSRTSHALVQQVGEILGRVAAGAWVVPGNHDLYADRLESLVSQPLGTLAKMPGIRLLMGTDPDLPGVCGIPYMSAFDGGDWKKALSVWLALADDTHELFVTHAPLFPPGQAPGVYASIDPAEWATQMPPATATYYGHIHDNHGIYTVASREFGGGSHLFANHGAISRGSLHEETVKRWPTVTLYASGEFVAVPLPSEVVKAPEDVFLFAKAEEVKERKSSAEEFAAAVGQVQLANLTPEEVIADLRAQGTQTETMKVIEDVIEHAVMS